MTNANSRQVGGGHYKTEYEHWDLVINTGMGYLEGCATKYISRWRKKDGLPDLAKARHYVDKLMEVAELHCPEGHGRVSLISFEVQCKEVEAFALANDLTEDEKFLIAKLVIWREAVDLEPVPEALEKLIAQNTPKPVPLEDSNKHAERE